MCLFYDYFDYHVRCLHIYVFIYLKYNVFDCYKYKRHINLSFSLVLALTSRVSHGRQSFEVFLQGSPSNKA